MDLVPTLRKEREGWATSDAEKVMPSRMRLEERVFEQGGCFRFCD